MNTPIEEAIRIVGSQSGLATAIQPKHPKVKQQHVWKWLRAGKIPAEYVLAIEHATGGKVTRYQLRPDVFGQDPNHVHVNVLQPEPPNEVA